MTKKVRYGAHNVVFFYYRQNGPRGRSTAEIVGSNPTGGMDVCLL